MNLQRRLYHLQRDRQKCRDLQRAAAPGTLDGRPFQMRTAQDIMALLEEQVGLVRAEEEAGTLEKARLIGYLSGIAVRVLETRDLAARIEMLENVLKARADQGKP